MRRNRIIKDLVGVVAFFGLIAGFLWLLPTLLNPQYFGLQRKSEKYYFDFATACDSVLAKHPIGTNENVMIDVKDPTLPKIITDLRPLKIQLGQQRFWMLLWSDSHAGFGLIWEPKWNDTNTWNLYTVAESMETILYSSNRNVSVGK